MRVVPSFHHSEIMVDAVVTRARVSEGLSTPFDVSVELVTQSSDLEPANLLWTEAALVLTPEGAAARPAGPRAFHGIVEEAHYLGAYLGDAGEVGGHRYSLRLRPTLHGLRYRVRSRIFQEKSAIEIIREVLEDAGVPQDSVRWETQTDPPSRVFCTQWKESELAFVSRLLEDEGIFYWFEHTDVDHTLCFGDDPSVHGELAGGPAITLTDLRPDDSEAIFGLVLKSARRHDAVKMRDWSFETADTPIDAQAGEQTSRARYEYPGGYADPAGGSARALLRREALTHDRMVLTGEAESMRLAPGLQLDVMGAHPATLDGSYTLTTVEHRYDGGARGTRHGVYSVSWRAIPAEVPFRPPRATPRPRVWGLESAVVTGPAGEEIHVDEHGRIKVHFYWDREQSVDDRASCWVRYQQLNTQGAMILPRVGWEVHVAFENGDPDRPIALHKVYNEETMPPYDLPYSKTQLALQSSTSPGGGSTNEIRLQDGAGGMEWFLHASRDLNVVVANDQDETVGIDCSQSVGGTLSTSVGGDETWSVGANQSLSVTADFAADTGGSKSITVGANDDWGVKGTFSFTTGGARTESIGGLMNVLANDIAITVNGSFSRTVGAVQVYAAAGSIAETVAGSKTETVGAAKAILTPNEVSEAIGGLKTLTSGAVTVKAGNEVSYKAEGALAVTAAAAIDISCSDDAMFTGSQVRVTSGSATLKGGGGEFEMGGKIKIDAKKFGGKGGPVLKLKGDIDFK